MSGSALARPLQLCVAGLIAACLCAAACSLPSAMAAGLPEKPNIVVVMTDDQRKSDMKAMRKTRRFMARGGAIFQRMWVTFPLCCPARATFLTGQYAHNTGVLSNGPPTGGLEAFDESATLATALDAEGYRTVWIGKYVNGYPKRAQEDPPYVPPGWDVWLGAAMPGRMFGWVQVLGDRLRTWAPKRQPRGYQTDVLARQARAEIGASLRADEPFFMTVATLAPHGERRSRAARPNPRPAHRHRRAFAKERFPRPPSFNERDLSDKPLAIQELPRLKRDQRHALRDRYRDRLASLLAVDDLVAGIVRKLRRHDAVRDTLVIFTSDNGVLMGEHRLRGKNVLYREAALVPFMMRGPNVPAGVRIGVPAGNVDIAPTILEAAGAWLPLPRDGVSLFDLMADPDAFADRDLVAQTETEGGLRGADYLYVEHPGGEREYYDTVADPNELHSIWDELDESFQNEIEARYAQLKDCEGAQCH